MKKTNLFAVLGLLCFFGGTTFAQRETNVEKLKENAQLLEKNYKKQRQEVLGYARKYNLPLQGVNTKGQFYWLHHIENGKPVYYATRNLGAATSMQTDKLWTGGSLGLNLNGQGMEVSTDRSRLGMWEPGVPRTTHQEFGSRLIIRDASTFSGPSSDNQHATHVAGTMMAAGTNTNAKGMAHQARMDSYDAANDVSEMNTAASEGMLVSNHSYGPSFPAPADYWQRGYYDSEAQAWDDLCYNAPFYLPVQACGNDRNEDAFLIYDLLLGSSTAKNTLGVGAVEKLTSAYSGPNSVVMSDFSSYGPTDDGRIKPDVVAPGVQIFSSSDNSNSDYANLDGTSMAGPAAAGTLFLLQQHYKNLNSGNFMRSATLRGLVIHTAEECGSNPGPDYAFGWGLINASRAIEVISNTGGSHILSQHTLNNSATYTQTITVPGGQPLRVTICWTDPAATPLPANPSSDNNRTSRLVNDLDLRVKDASNADIELPWKLDPNNPSNAANRGDNNVDNVEQIYVAALPAGTYTIRVTHKGTLTGGSQAFSLIVTGVSAPATPPTAPTALSATAISSSQINLSWTDNASDEAGYKVERSTDGGVTFTEIEGSLPANTTTYSNTGLTASTTYHYRVRAFNANGNSAYSNVANATTQSSEITAISAFLDKNVKVSPVPTKDFLQIDLGQIPYQDVQISLYNQWGNRLATLTQKAPIFQLDLRHYAKGMYYLRIQNPDGFIVRKIIVE